MFECFFFLNKINFRIVVNNIKIISNKNIMINNLMLNLFFVVFFNEIAIIFRSCSIVIKYFSKKILPKIISCPNSIFSLKII